MLDAETKRRIDTARDILVGKVPDPKSQVEQITIALIYKFMDDMDADAEELGGNRRFFAGEFDRFGWPKLMRSGLGGHEILNLYAEAIDRMQENPGIPQLFRDIFNNAYLPYRDPETLRAFLKVIDEFNYDHSERLGDAFEYLLSVLGSQGDAGQFRTPRHIIDFIVAVVDPKKNETILDPACGTAGFLISSYKHILAANTDEKRNSTLTPDERGRLTGNFSGYDISPDMVRLSLVNMYLHGFQEPHIFEYDTLTSEERWNEYADVILANPPFMSPKGGIRPHNRFSVKSKRSEVLFVDYMAEHLTPSGRAGIIVPEGIIFQSQNAHKQLRKMLVEEYLVAVVSLPAGVFNPYSGVKTSILILDKALAKRTDRIAFFKVENDGFDLGAQRRPIDQNDLPQTQLAVREYLRNVGNMDGQDGQDKGDPPPSVDLSALEQLVQQGAALIVEKTRIEEGGEYNLSGERYRESGIRGALKWPTVELGSVTGILNGYAFKSENYVNEGIRVIRITNVQNGTIVDDNPKFYPSSTRESLSRYLLHEGDLLLSLTGNVGRVGTLDAKFLPAALNQRVACLRPDLSRALQRYIFHLLNQKGFEDDCIEASKGLAQKNLSTIWLSKYRIPLPPLDVQREIVAEIEGYQRVIDGARAVIDNYKPHIPIDPDWPMRDLSDVAIKVTDGTHRTPTYTESGIPFLRVTDITKSNTSKKFISEEEHLQLIKRCHPENGDVLYTKNGTIGVAKVVDWDDDFSIFVSLALIKPRHDLIDSRYLESYLNSNGAYDQATSRSKSGTVTNLHLVDIKTIRIPLPALSEQLEIVAEMDAEKKLVDANCELVERFEKKIQVAIGRVWGDGEHK